MRKIIWQNLGGNGSTDFCDDDILADMNSSGLSENEDEKFAIDKIKENLKKETEVNFSSVHSNIVSTAFGSKVKFHKPITEYNYHKSLSELFKDFKKTTNLKGNENIKVKFNEARNNVNSADCEIPPNKKRKLRY